VTALLECAATQLYRVELDKQPIENLRYDIARDPRSELRGFQAMIDIRELSPGAHEPSIYAPRKEDEQDVAEARWIIPFWR